MKLSSILKSAALIALVASQSVTAESSLWQTISSAPRNLLEALPGGSIAADHPLATLLLATGAIYTAEHLIAKYYYNDARGSWINQTVNYLLDRCDQSDYIAELENQIAHLSAQKSQLEGKILQLADSLEQAEDSRHALLQALEKTVEHIQHLEQIIDKLNAENDMARDTIVQWTAAISNLNHNFTTLSNKINTNA